MEGEPKDFLIERAKAMHFDDYGFEAVPTIFWDPFGEQGHPIRTTISEMGPLMLSRLMGLSDAQEGALNIAFKLADKEGLALLDLKDLRALLKELGERGKELTTEYGSNLAAPPSAPSARSVVLEEQGGNNFFGEPARHQGLHAHHAERQGYMNVLAADKLINSPQLYATFLLWMMSELFEKMPKWGTPRSRAWCSSSMRRISCSRGAPGLIQKIEQTVKLIRSKGIGIYFVTQNPLDIPESVLARWATACSMRSGPIRRASRRRWQRRLDLPPEPRLQDRGGDHPAGQGRGLVSVLDPKGVPTMVERTMIRPPSSRMGPITPEERQKIIKNSPVYGSYEQVEDRESAYEILMKRTEQRTAAADRRRPRRKRRSRPAPRPAPRPSAKPPPTASSRTWPPLPAARSATSSSAGYWAG